MNRFGAGIVWVLGLDPGEDWDDKVDVIVAWHAYHCWLAWFYRGGDTTLTVVMPHDDADVEAAQTLSEWQGQGAPRGSAPDPCPNTLFDPPLLDGWAGRLG